MNRTAITRKSTIKNRYFPIFILTFMFFALTTQNTHAQCPSAYSCDGGTNTIDLSFEAGNSSNDTQVANAFVASNMSFVVNGVTYNYTSQTGGGGTSVPANVTYTPTVSIAACPNNIDVGVAIGCGEVSEDECYSILFFDDNVTNNCNSSNGDFSFMVDDIGNCGPYSVTVTGNSAINGGAPFIIPQGSTMTFDPNTIKAGIYIFAFIDGDGDDTYIFYNHITRVDGNCVTETDLQIDKVITAGNPYSAAGDMIMYTYNVTTSGGDVTGPIMVTDNLIATVNYVSGDDGDNVLESNETWVYTATYIVSTDDVTAGSITNTAFANSTTIFSGPDAETATLAACAVPTLTCPITENVFCGNTPLGSPSLTVAPGETQCEDYSISAPVISTIPSYCDGGTYTRTWTLLFDADGAGGPNAAAPVIPSFTCSQMVMVTQDVTGPMITDGCTTTSQALDCNQSLPDAKVIADFTFTDDCSASSIILSSVVLAPISGAASNLCSATSADRTVTRTYTFRDACDNETTCVETFVFARDLTGPSISCTDITINLNADGLASTTAAELISSATDLCTDDTSISITTAQSLSFDCMDIGDNDITVTVTDQCNNSTQCTSTITVDGLQVTANGPFSYMQCSDVALDIDVLGLFNNASTYTYSVVSSDPSNVPPGSDVTSPSTSNIEDSYTNTTGSDVTITYAITAVSANSCIFIRNLELTVHPEGMVTSMMQHNICSEAPLNINVTGNLLDEFQLISITNNGLMAGSGNTVTTNGVSYAMNALISDTWINNTANPVIVTYEIRPVNNVPSASLACLGDPFELQITVNPNLTLDITQPDLVCSPEMVDISILDLGANISGGTVTYHNSQVGAHQNMDLYIGSTTAISLSRNIYVRYEIASGCYTTGTIQVEVANCAIAIVKTSVFQDENTDTYGQVGETIDYTFSVTNTGNVELNSVTINDPLFQAPNVLVTVSRPSGDDGDDILQLTETWTYTATYTLTQNDINTGSVSNQATATAEGPNGNPADDSDDITDESDDDSPSEDDTTVTTLGQNPSIAIVKTSTFQDENTDTYGQGGETIDYTFSVTNTGNVELNSVTINDPLFQGPNVLVTVSGPSGDNGDDILQLTETWTYTATYTLTQNDINTGSVSNQATATAEGPNGNPADDSDDITDESDDDSPSEDDTTVTTLGQNPSIAIVKTSVFQDENTDTYGQVGETIDYTFTVTNTGNVDLNSVVINDPLFQAPNVLVTVSGPSGDDGDDILQLTETWTYTATYTLTQNDIDFIIVTNQATITAEGPNGNPTDDSDDVTDVSDSDDPLLPDEDDATVTCVMGVAKVVTICNAELGTLNLNNTLSLNALPSGTWTETSTTSSEVDFSNPSEVSFMHVPAGDYIFRYTLNDIVGCYAKLTVTVTNCFDMALRKLLVTTGNISPGDQVEFNIEVFNQGSVDAFDIEISDFLSNISFAFDPLLNTAAATGNTNDWDMNVAGDLVTTIPSIVSNSMVTLKIYLTVNINETALNLNNEAQISFATNVSGSPILAIDEDYIDPLTSGGVLIIESDNDISDESTGGTDNIFDNDAFDFAAVAICLLNANNIDLPSCDINIFNQAIFDLSNAGVLESIDSEGDGDGSIGDGDTGNFVSFYSTETDAMNVMNPLPAFYTSMSTTIFARLENANGCFAVSEVALQLLSTPIITIQPTMDTDCNGTMATFSVEATGTNLIYQWQILSPSGFINLTGENEPTLELLNINNSMNGHQYRVIVSSSLIASCSNVYSDIITLALYQQQPLACNNNIQISINESCEALITVDMVAEGDISDTNLEIILTDQAGNLVSNPITADYIDQTISVKLLDLCNINSCWGYITVEDKLAPVLDCPSDITVGCNESFVLSDLTHAALDRTFGYDQANGISLNNINVIYDTDPGPLVTPQEATDGGTICADITVEGLNQFDKVNSITVDLNLTPQNISMMYEIDIYDPNGNLVNSFTSNNGMNLNISNVAYLDVQAIDGIYEGAWRVCISDNFGADNIQFRFINGTVRINSSGFFNSQLTTADNCNTISFDILTDNTESIDCGDIENVGISAIRTITCQGTDPSGNKSNICTKNIFFERKNLIDIEWPANYTEECSISLSTNPDVTGRPSIGAQTIHPNNGFCEINLIYSDNKIDICGASFKLLRSWTALDWCEGTTLTYTQIIKIADTKAPVIQCGQLFADAEANPYTCTADLTVPAPNDPADADNQIVVFDCSEVSYRIKWSQASVPIDGVCNNTTATSAFDYRSDGVTYDGNSSNLDSDGFASSGTFSITDLPVGCIWIYYELKDECGNISSCTRDIKIVDNTPPIPVCDQFTVVSLSSNGRGQAFALSFDDGSHDNCSSSVSYGVRRMVNSCGQSTGVGNSPTQVFSYGGDQYYDLVEFCCADVGEEEVLVELVVWDASGNANVCMINVTVDNKVDPVITCNNVTNNLNIDCVDAIPTAPALEDVFTVSYDICDKVAVRALEETSTTPNNCGLYIITRRWEAYDITTDAILSTCSQIISIVNEVPVNLDTQVSFPSDKTLNGCMMVDTDPESPNGPGVPTYTGAINCSQLEYTYIDQTFHFVDNVCFKILRKWTVIDWCTFNQNQPNGPGIKEYTQVIKVSNSAAPVFESCATQTICSYENTCEGEVDLKTIAIDDCTPADQIEYSYVITLDNGGETRSGNSNNAKAVYPIGSHSVTWTAEDQCGNASTCTHTFIVEDCKSPTPYCFSDITTVVMPSTGFISIAASDFDLGSTDNCTAKEDLRFSFGTNTSNTHTTFGCDKLGLNEVEMWVTDLAGNQDFCTVNIIIQDNLGGTCDDVISDMIQLGGKILSPTNVAIENVDLTLSSSLIEHLKTDLTNNVGEYVFDNIPLGYDYSVSASDNNDPLNGVSTLDLVMIQRHILGLSNFDSPYKLIASDINNDHKITAADLSKLRKLILGVTTDFDNGQKSWRFVNTTNAFADLLSPFPYNEKFDLINVQHSLMDNNYVGVKIGDVNQSAQYDLKANQKSETRENNNMNVQIPQIFASAGEEVSVPVYIHDLAEFRGYQFTLNFDNKNLIFKSIKCHVSGMNEANFGLRNTDNGMISTSWNGEVFNVDKPIFTIIFESNFDQKINDDLTISSDITQAEAYDLDFNIYGISLGTIPEINNTTEAFEIYQNSPNPFHTETSINYNTPRDGMILLKVFDIRGNLIFAKDIQAKKGNGSFILRSNELKASGMLYYQVTYEKEILTKKMIRIE